MITGHRGAVAAHVGRGGPHRWLKAIEAAGRSPNYVRTHWIMVRAFLRWLVSEQVIAASPVDRVTVDVDPALDRTREIVVPDFRFLDLLSQRLGNGEDRLVFELLLGYGRPALGGGGHGGR